VGWAEVHLPNAVDLHDHLTRLEYDLYYLKHYGPLIDIAVVLRTFWLLLSERRWRADSVPEPLRSDAIDLTGSRSTTQS
jgi:lipopolysaccharide/colanic/teichoic acid biosynthesis glycosyltransferase